MYCTTTQALSLYTHVVTGTRLHRKHSFLTHFQPAHTASRIIWEKVMMLTIPIKTKKRRRDERNQEERGTQKDKRQKHKQERRKKRRETVQRSFEEHNLLGDKKTKEMYMFWQRKTWLFKRNCTSTTAKSTFSLAKWEKASAVRTWWHLKIGQSARFSCYSLI
jgi:hypothetical protein